MTDIVMNTETDQQPGADMTEDQRAFLAKIDAMKAKTKHLRFGTRLLDNTMDASTRVLRGLIREP
jgi:hypothetical protein